MPRLCEIFANAAIDVNRHVSTSVGNLEEQVRVAVDGGADRIVVAGGDGSIHEAVNGILRAEKPARLGVIPAGTGNDFAKACAIPLDWELATEQLAARLATNKSYRQIDVGRMNDRYFANGAGIGFDAKVTKVARSYRWPIGDFVYLFAILRCMIDGIATPRVTIVADELSWDAPLTLANISNGAWVGGMFHIAPMARNNDGRLELLIAGPVSRLRILSLLPSLMRGKHMDAQEILHASVRRVRIEASAPVPSHLDGEVGAVEQNFDIEVLPASLDLL
jgi:diacylglycerol kinase (ATP)